MYCAYLWACSDRAWYTANCTILRCAETFWLNITPKSFWISCTLCTLRWCPYKWEYSLLLLSFDRRGYWFNILSFHSTQVFLSPVKLLPTLMLWNIHSFLNKSPSDFLQHTQKWMSKTDKGTWWSANWSHAENETFITVLGQSTWVINIFLTLATAKRITNPD